MSPVVLPWRHWLARFYRTCFQFLWFICDWCQNIPRKHSIFPNAIFGVISGSFEVIKIECIKDGLVYIDDFFGNFMAGKLMANLPSETMEDVEVLFIRLIKLGGYKDTLTYHECRTIVHTVLNFTHPDIFDSSDNDSIINAFSRWEFMKSWSWIRLYLINGKPENLNIYFNRENFELECYDLISRFNHKYILFISSTMMRSFIEITAISRIGEIWI